jgi:hypothetical protein
VEPEETFFVRQLLGKQVNAGKNRRAAFSMWSAPRPLLCTGEVNTPVQQQRGCVFCVAHAEGLYKGQR